MCRSFRSKLKLDLHRTPEGLETNLQPKNGQTRGYSGVGRQGRISSYVTHQYVISYSWILAISRAFSPLKSTSSTTAFNRQKRSWNLSISMAREPTSQLDPLLVASLCRLVVIHSGATYVIRHGRKWVASHSWDFYLMHFFAVWHR